MSGLAHFFEDEGLSTVLVALVKEHAEKVQPPRALWVPFMLGRPFGEPNNPELQKNVIRQSLRLLDESSGPVLRDADVSDPDLGQAESWACPVSFSKEDDETPIDEQIANEIVALRPWYNLHVKNGQRTTVGLSESSIEACVDGLEHFCTQPDGFNSAANEVVNNLRWWASDVKAFYMEAAIAQPGKARAHDLENWFWDETAAGFLLKKIRKLCIEHSSLEIREVGLYMIGEIESEHYVDEYGRAERLGED